MYKNNTPNIIKYLLTEENIKNIEHSKKWILNYYISQIDITSDEDN
jgi:hypothetical protein